MKKMSLMSFKVALPNIFVIGNIFFVSGDVVKVIANDKKMSPTIKNVTRDVAENVAKK